MKRGMGQESFSVGGPDHQHFFLLAKHGARDDPVRTFPIFRLPIFRDIQSSSFLGHPLFGPVGNSDWGFGKCLQTLSTDEDHPAKPESD